jgi:hypothetical protein
MVVVAQLVRALVCGSRGRGFKSPLPPILSPVHSGLFFYPLLSALKASNLRYNGKSKSAPYNKVVPKQS